MEAKDIYQIMSYVFLFLNIIGLQYKHDKLLKSLPNGVKSKIKKQEINTIKKNYFYVVLFSVFLIVALLFDFYFLYLLFVSFSLSTIFSLVSSVSILKTNKVDKKYIRKYIRSEVYIATTILLAFVFLILWSNTIIDFKNL